jgi:hypothetical protein
VIKYLVTVEQESVEIAINVSYPNEKAEIQYSGDKVAIALFSKWLGRQSGAFGHLIGQATSPIDLHCVLSKPEAKQYQPQIIEGKELVKSYDPQIPDGAIT